MNEYPKIIIEEGDEIEAIERDLLVKCFGNENTVAGNRYRLAVRTEGEFKERGFYLSGSFDWIIGTDSHDVLVLLPLKKIAGINTMNPDQDNQLFLNSRRYGHIKTHGVLNEKTGLVST